jgi:hypothetical protein
MVVVLEERAGSMVLLNVGVSLRNDMVLKYVRL